MTGSPKVLTMAVTTEPASATTAMTIAVFTRETVRVIQDGCLANAPKPGLRELPGGAGGSVGDLDAEGFEFSPDLVGAPPVPVRAGLGAVGDLALDQFDLRGVEIGSGPAAVHLAHLEPGEAEAEQRVGGRDHDAQPLGADVGVAERLLEGGEDLRRRQVGGDRRVEVLQVRG